MVAMFASGIYGKVALVTGAAIGMAIVQRLVAEIGTWPGGMGILAEDAGLMPHRLVLRNGTVAASHSTLPGIVG